MPQVTCSVSKILSYMSGNQGLTKKTIHYDRKNLGADAIEVLSSSIIDDTSMGYVSRNLILPNKKHTENGVHPTIILNVFLSVLKLFCY